MAEQQVNDTSTDLIVIGDDFTLPIVPTAQVKAIAQRLFPMLPTFPQKFLPQEAVLVAEIALARGHNPLSVGKQYHAWKDNHGKVCIQDHFAAEETWAQGKEKFRAIYHDLDETEKSAMGISVKDYACACTILRASYEHLYQERYNSILNAAIIAKIDFSEALKVAEREALKIGVTHIGRVKYEEVFDETGKVKKGAAGDLPGWLPGITRSHVRALRGAIHQVYGTPTFAEMARLGMKSTAEDMPEIIAEMPNAIAKESKSVQQKYIQLVESNNERNRVDQEIRNVLGEDGYKEFTQKRHEKNALEMRGEVLADDWLDEKNPTVHIKIDERKAPDDVVTVQKEDISIEPNPQAEALEDELANEALSLGGVAAKPETTVAGSLDEAFPPEPAKNDDVGVAMSIGDVKMAMSPLYKTTNVQLDVLHSIFGPEASFETMSQIQLWNLKEYSKRAIILHEEIEIAVPERIAKIPELAEVKTESPMTLDFAKDYLKQAVRELGSGKEMKELV